MGLRPAYTVSSVALSWRPDWDAEGMKERTHRSTYGKTGIKWTVLALLEQHRLCTTGDLSVFTVQHGKESQLVSVGSLCWEAVLGCLSGKRRLQLSAFAYTANIYTWTRGGFASSEPDLRKALPIPLDLRPWFLSIIHIHSRLYLPLHIYSGLPLLPIGLGYIVREILFQKNLRRSLLWWSTQIFNLSTQETKIGRS